MASLEGKTLVTTRGRELGLTEPWWVERSITQLLVLSEKYVNNQAFNPPYGFSLWCVAFMKG